LPSARATALLGRCLVCDRGQGEEIARCLTVGDREALLLHLRRLTFGETIDCKLQCPVASCRAFMDLTMNVSDLLVAPYGEVQQAYHTAIEVDGVAYSISFRLPIAADLDRAAGIAQHEPRRAALELLRNCLLRIGAEQREIDFDALPDSAYPAIVAAIAERDPQAEIQLELTCPTCNASFAVVFDTASFLLQELDVRTTRVLREVHTLALHYHWSEADILAMPAVRRAHYIELISAATAHRRRMQ
jgi:hypothetical protein